MTAEDGRAIEHKTDAEAHALVDCYNAAKASYSPKLEWFAMSTDHDTGDQSFVFQAADYIDGDGLAALRACGRTVQYIEAYEFDGEVGVQIELPVQGDIPEWGDFDDE